ncbi:hypothetical protein WKW80_36855 [Variovorax humicola]|uniref:Acetyl-CoA hydrolase/transferase N-terminal domain-containing protein n=1 Tax=Variovorax humicola TaxID=1769758 RepID=A0ABU8WBP7_9BURK
MAVLKVCPMDENGFFNLSAANLWHRAIVSRAKVVIVEVTAGLPYLHGVDNGVHFSEVDYVIEGDHRPAANLPNPPPTAADRVVARLIAAEIENGACLQVGSAPCPMPCVRCCWKAVCATSACTPKG